MSKRNSEYKRRARDHYPTPEGPLDALLSAVPLAEPFYEACPGGGRSALAQQLWDRKLKCVVGPPDFFKVELLPPGTRTILTNPPFKLAAEIIDHALELMATTRIRLLETGASSLPMTMALLLPTDYDHAAKRRQLFHPMIFVGQVKLTRRIVWFKPKPPKRAGPSEWHSWFLWQHAAGQREPWVRYATWDQDANLAAAKGGPANVPPPNDRP